ncbi:methyltransferase domain-containing protein [uncultured Ruminococcus sp.]|uniref:class I SAM-dependent methyltransferase n=1 Tax=uncultured Ruminococcus sp. TaxID=165186 RepID=UPI0025F6859F|nr:methyltransferase domain-containing protein [uncultured Ruminococcus sp.]
MIKDSRIDGGKPFDWGLASEAYSKYRDIYPEEFYQKIISLGLCTEGQNVLDVGTGTGVLPRNLCRFGAKFTGSDISPQQIEQAKLLSNGKDIDYITASAEDTADMCGGKKFDVITACQCFWYFKHDVFAEKAHSMLNDGGKLAFLCMEWLPFDDEIAGKSEELILKFNPSWSGCGETRHQIAIDEAYKKYFKITDSIVFDADVPFTRESWNGRMIACRGIGASLEQSEIERFSAEHMEMLSHYPESFTIKHYCAIAVMEKI